MKKLYVLVIVLVLSGVSFASENFTMISESVGYSIGNGDSSRCYNFKYKLVDDEAFEKSLKESSCINLCRITDNKNSVIIYKNPFYSWGHINNFIIEKYKEDRNRELIFYTGTVLLDSDVE